eukprot:GHVO01058502.1.p3 GENE.GHVO01058502.1~~GHVO01058502.1.p3  ORF type:complete len:118 (-),score=1.45 GHVO01058502.1:507-860(-)
MLAIVLKKPALVAVSAFAPVRFSVRESPFTSVPTMLKDLLLSFPADKIVTCLPEAFVTLPPEAKAPPITKAALLPTEAATEIPSASKACSSRMNRTCTSEFAMLISYEVRRGLLPSR